MEKILVLGASGFIGMSIYRHLRQCIDIDVYGTYFTSQINDSHIYYFSLEKMEQMKHLLTEIAPDIVISTLRGNYEKQLEVHNLLAEYLMKNHGKLLYFSTVNVFDGNLECPHYEDDCVNSVSEYGRFKICCENQLRKTMGNQVIIIRIPFVYGRNSPRICQIRESCKTGLLDVYTNLLCNYVTDVQIAEYVEWIIREKKEGIFHVGTTDMVQHRDFVNCLAKRLNIRTLNLDYIDMSGTMAVFTKRKDIPHRLEWNVQRVAGFLCNEEE